MQRLGDDWTDDQRELWDGFSTDFRDHFEQWTLQAAGSLGRALGLDQAARVVEVGCGAGGAGVLLRPTLAPGASWTALDLSPKMVSLAREALGPDATVVAGSAEALPFDDGAFDRLLSNMCLMLVADPVQALREAHRVTAPGGRAGWSVWGRVEQSPMMTLVGQACDALGVEVPVAERPNFHLGGPGVLAEQVAAAGFDPVQSVHEPMEIRVADGAEFAQEMLYTGQRRKRWMASLGQDLETALVAEVAGQADAVLASGRSLSLDVLQVVATR
jgi:SAM-dependent methyltransferase